MMIAQLDTYIVVISKQYTLKAKGLLIKSVWDFVCIYLPLWKLEGFA